MSTVPVNIDASDIDSDWLKFLPGALDEIALHDGLGEWVTVDEKYGRFVTLDDEGGGRVVFIGGPGQGAGGSSAGSASGALKPAKYVSPITGEEAEYIQGLNEFVYNPETGEWEQQSRSDEMIAQEIEHAKQSAQRLQETEDVLLENVETKGNTNNTRDVLDSERSRVKDELVTRLSEDTGVEYEKVNEMVKQWSYTSNDEDPKALVIQQEAAKMFGAPLSEWQEQKILKTQNSPYYDSYMNSMPWTRGEVRKVLNAMYENTQANLQEAGVPEIVTLRRGVKGLSLDRGQTHNIFMNTLSSWTSNAETAYKFADYGHLLEIQIPRERILCSCLTGFGCLSEGEFVIIGNNRGNGDEVFAVPETYTWLQP